MKTTMVNASKTMRLRFIGLQILITLLVIVTIVSFSDIRIAPVSSQESNKAISQANVNTVDENEYKNLQSELARLQNLLAEKDKQLKKMDSEISTLRQNPTATPVVDNDQIEQLKASIAELNNSNSSLQTQNEELKQTSQQKDVKIGQLEREITNLRSNRNPVATASQQTSADRNLRNQLQESESRYAALLRSNKELKRNNEYLTAQLNALQAKR